MKVVSLPCIILLILGGGSVFGFDSHRRIPERLVDEISRLALAAGPRPPSGSASFHLLASSGLVTGPAAAAMDNMRAAMDSSSLDISELKSALALTVSLLIYSNANPNSSGASSPSPAPQRRPFAADGSGSGVQIQSMFQPLTTHEQQHQQQLEVEVEAASSLMCVYNALGGDAWTSRTNWNSNVSVCKWFGVTCNTSNMVIGLQLKNNNLRGVLPNRCFMNMTSITYM